MGIRELAARYGVHRRTVRRALESASPPARKRRSFAAPRLDPAKPLIDAMLRVDLDAPRKQRHTARRVLARLVDEHQLEVSYSSVRDYVARRRPEILAEAGRAAEQGASWREDLGPEWTSFPIARLRYTIANKSWTLLWRDRNLRFHSYDPLAPTQRVEDLLTEIDRDPTCIFWG